MAEPQRKRTRVNEKDSNVAQFLDVEASVDHEDDSAEEDDEDLEDFLDDEADDGETIRSSSVSTFMDDVAPSDDHWSALLARARLRSQEERRLRVALDSAESGNDDNILSRVLIDNLADETTAMSENTTANTAGELWRVPVKVGREEEITIILFEKWLLGGSSFPSIRSIIGRRRLPGSVYVEAPDFRDVQKLCSDVLDVHSNRIQPITPQEAHRYLDAAPFAVPKAHSWARITKSRTYKNDLAYVHGYDSKKGADVVVVPRVKSLPSLKVFCNWTI
ncbi:hypothetical protein H0H93_012815 [Arthromyces matolae]|nr:hypothetical protein H0H93_012815 [Arthromyces matolae]